MNKTATKWAIRVITLLAMTLWCFSVGATLLALNYEIFEMDSYVETSQARMQAHRELGPFLHSLDQAKQEATFELERQGKIYYDEAGKIPSIVARNRLDVLTEEYRQEIFTEMGQHFLHTNLDLRVVSTDNGEKPLDTIGNGDYGPMVEQGIEGYRIYAAIRNPATEYMDNFSNGDLVFRTFKANIPVLFWTLGVSSILSLAGVCLLAKTAGRKHREDGIFPGKLERFPSDLLWICGLGALFLLVMPVVIFSANELWCISDLLVDNNLRNVLLLAGISFVFMAAIVELLVTSTAIRVKTHNFWHNTSVAMFWRWTARGMKKIPTIWRACLVALGVFAINGILGMISLFGWFAWLLFALYNLFLVVTVCGFAWQMKQLQEGAKRLANGNLNEKIDTSHLYYDCKVYGETLNTISQGMGLAVDEKLRSQRMKTELISNVSHDIKTPLTSIVTCVELLQKDHTDQEHREYLELLQRQSMRMKKLVENLVEASKASTGNVAVHLETLDLVEIVEQALGEYASVLEEKHLHLVSQLPETCTITADGKLLWRVLDNLLGNIGKYAMEGTRVYVIVTQEEKTSLIFKNISANPIEMAGEELLERFVRGDASRTTEGSGLGLNIAQSLMQLQGGSLELTLDGDLFKVQIRL